MEGQSGLSSLSLLGSLVFVVTVVVWFFYKIYKGRPTNQAESKTEPEQSVVLQQKKTVVRTNEGNHICPVCSGNMGSNPGFCFDCCSVFPEKRSHKIQTSSWANTLYVFGCLFVIAGIIVAIAGIGNKKDGIITLGGFIFASGIALHFWVFIINIATDMRHYLMSLTETLERIETINLQRYR